jgi:uncharacterized membrane protein YdcZ (DUF606 family)
VRRASGPLGTATGAPPSTATRAIGIGLAVLAGAAVAVQARINAELSARLHDGVAAAAVSFGTGLVIVTALIVGTATGADSSRYEQRCEPASFDPGSASAAFRAPTSS